MISSGLIKTGKHKLLRKKRKTRREEGTKDKKV